MIKVLYIDDESMAEKMKSRFEILAENGIKVHPEFKLRKVIQELPELIQNNDLIVVDLIMPPRNEFEMDETDGGSLTGIALIKKIREISKKIPIIIVSIRGSGSVDNSVLEKYNVSSFQNKSIPTVDLIDIIKTYAK